MADKTTSDKISLEMPSRQSEEKAHSLEGVSRKEAGLWQNS